MKKIQWLAMVVALLTGTQTLADGIICETCDPPARAVMPETGSWFNPDQPGTGLSFEIQNGHLAGFYYGFNTEGSPEWFLVSGDLEPSDTEGVLWELSTHFQFLEGGNCLGCDYQQPDDPKQGLAVKFEFRNRSALEITMGDAGAQEFFPIIFGSGGFAYFHEVTPYIFPAYEGRFALIFKPAGAASDPESWEFEVRPIAVGEIADKPVEERTVTYLSWFEYQPPGLSPVFDLIVCALDADSDWPVCEMQRDELNYRIQIENLSDTRFFGVAGDGSTVEGYRIEYD